jgi:hypothetical protein
VIPVAGIAWLVVNYPKALEITAITIVGVAAFWAGYGVGALLDHLAGRS